ncbi:hypothetical protein KPH14_010515 [Odynerus spinipes]|uniref:Uncharacterized protein n=1 Tax=Odynerus spinipes TaxID=1348599 RepID=A0AAD9VT29_9HYME|nr:hypothetical protein KPH14_010515 [Odynerus spinipes]
MSKEQRKKPNETCGLDEKKKDSHCDQEAEIRWFDNYDRRVREGAAANFKSKDLLNYCRYIQREYCREISSDDDYRSSSVREFDDVRPVRSVKGKRTRPLRTKQGFRSRHRKARPKRKRIQEILGCPSRNCELCEVYCPSYERSNFINNDESFTRYLFPNKRRSKLTYPASRLLKRYSSRLVSPKSYGRYLKKGSREWQGVNNFEVIKQWPEQRLSRTKNEREHRSESRRPLRVNNFEEAPKKRSTDSIYINPRFERGYFSREEAPTTKKETEVRSCVADKTNESSFQKRLSGGSNFSCSTNNQYCPRLDGPSSCEEEDDGEEVEGRERIGANKSRSPRREKEASRKEERKIRGKFDWVLKDSPCVRSRSRYTQPESFSSLSSARSTKGVTFERNGAEISCKTPRRMPRSSRKAEKTPLVVKRVHYEPKCIRTSNLRKNKEDDGCYLCDNAKLLNDKSDPRHRKLCKLVRSREGKKLLDCCCSGNEQEDDAECGRFCRCPENLRMFQARPQYDTLKTYERSWKGKDILHSTSLPGTSCGPSSSSRLVEDTCKNKTDHPNKDAAFQDLSPDVSLSDHWRKCKDRLKDFNEEYRKLSNDVKSIREIYCSRDKARKKIDRCYQPTEKAFSTFEPKSSPKRTNSRSPGRLNEIPETDCDCTEFLRDVSPSACPYDRYARSFDRHDARLFESRKKLEKDSMRKLENFCDKVKAMNRAAFDGKPKTNLESKTLNEDHPWCDCRREEESETTVQELWKPSKKSTWKEWPAGNSVDLRIIKPKRSSGKANLEKILIYPPEGAAGPPLTLLKNSSNISCQVKGDVDRGFRYNVTYVQKFISPSWRPLAECPDNTKRRNSHDCDCSSDYG